jgi:hypothetical protein
VFYKACRRKLTARTAGANPDRTRVPAARVTELNAAYADRYAAWGKPQQPHTSAGLPARDQAREAGKGILQAGLSPCKTAFYCPCRSVPVRGMSS